MNRRVATSGIPVARHPLAHLALGLAFGALVGCQARATTPSDGRTCEQKQLQLLSVLEQLPQEGRATPIEVSLPASALSGSFGKGPIVELSPGRVAVDGEVLPAKDLDTQLTVLRERIARVDGSPPIYIAADWQTDIAVLHDYLEAIPEQFELKLVFVAPALPQTDEGEGPTSDGEYDVAAKILAERDVAKRVGIAAEGYDEYSDCDAVDAAVASLKGIPVKERWPSLRSRMLEAIPKCPCADIDADGLRQLLVAEQRAGTVALGSIPISFLRDRRCVAAMPMDTVQQVLDEIDEFDAEFSGDWKDDALVFDKVVTDDRLLVYLCVAMAGETVTWLARKHDPIYLRTSAGTCQAWRFEPLAKGAPMGTFRRDPASGPDLALHYRQGANEIRLFGPIASSASNPTDPGPWGCNEEFKMVEVDERSIRLDGGPRWYFDEASCRAAASDPVMKGCVANLTVGIAPPAVDAEEEHLQEPGASSMPSP